MIVSQQIHWEISASWVSGSVICHASDGPFYTHTWSDHRKFMMRILIVWGWIDSSDLSLASDQLNVRPRLRPNQLRGSGIPWFIVWAKSGLICPSYEGGQIARESIYPSICSWRCLLQSVCQFWLLFLSLCSLSGPPISFSCRVLYLFCLSLIVMFGRSCNPLSLSTLWYGGSQSLSGVEVPHWPYLLFLRGGSNC